MKKVLPVFVLSWKVVCSHDVTEDFCSIAVHPFVVLNILCAPRRQCENFDRSSYLSSLNIQKIACFRVTFPNSGTIRELGISKIVEDVKIASKAWLYTLNLSLRGCLKRRRSR